MNEGNTNGGIDLGSVSPLDFNPFADEVELLDDGTGNVSADTTVAADKLQPPLATNQPQTTNASNSDSDNETEDATNPMETAISNAEAKTAAKAVQSLYDKLPIFDFAAAKEDIEDTSQTFEDLRIAKAVDFPELEDGKRVTWSVEYGKTTKTVSDPKGMTIAKMKSDIEKSKEFMDSLKKAKDKNPVCKIKPRVTAQSKGVVSTSGYKGVFANIDEVNAAGKAISYLPARDGKVYEIRDNALGRFITPVAGCDLLSDVRAGYTPALGIPRIPMDLIMRIIAFFRYLTFNGAGKEPKEALVNIYWDSQHEIFVVDTPEQIVSNVSVHSNENLDFLNERYIHYMDIHSHNTMRAYFSETDNADEKATRLYTVIGRLDKFFPEIKTRISNGGKFHEIEPSEVFEFIARTFPEEWKEKVNFRKAHKDEGVNPDDRDMSRHGFDVNKSCVPCDDECCEKDIKDSYGYGVGDGS